MNAPAKASRVVRLNASDNVVVAVDPIEPGAEIEGARVTERVPRGHKLSVTAIPEGAPVRKFGQVIGFASKPIAPGQWVHEHNCGMGGVHGDFGRDYRFAEEAKQEIILPAAQQATFEGYRRAGG